jgi:multiple sugar transport system substrate-binding protein
MMEREQYEPWQRACIGYVSHPLKAYDANPVWTEDPQHMFFRDVVRRGGTPAMRASWARSPLACSPISSSSTCSLKSVRAADGEGSRTASGEAGAAALSDVSEVARD